MKMARIALLLLAVMMAAPIALAQSGLDQSKWYALDEINETGWCAKKSQAMVNGGMLTLTALSGSVTCNGGTAPYSIGALISPFYFTYGHVKVVAKLASTGVHSTLWLWGGAPGTSGYPPTCLAAIKARGIYMASCTADASNAYEIDFGEMVPRDGTNRLTNATHTWVNGSTVSGGPVSVDTGIDLSQDFHTYELFWSSTSLVFKLDGTTTNTFALTAGTYDQPMFLLIDQEIDYYAGDTSAGRYPLTTQVKSVEVWDQSSALIFSDYFTGQSSWFGVPF